MLKFMSLSSGSCGNCYFLHDGERGIVIDAGVSVRRLKKYLCEKGYSLDSFQAVLVTHDHLDHIRHLGSWCKRLEKPVYATAVLHEALLWHTFTRDWIAPCGRVLSPEGSIIRLAPDLPDSECPWVVPFEVPHDASQTVGFLIKWHGCSFFLMTDAGRVTEEALEYASTAGAVVIESNYDTGMLIGGPYTHELKMRICKGNGHLSNDECASAVKAFWHKGLKHIFLCHLSENNNTPALAYSATAEALRSIDAGDGLTARELTDLQTLPRSFPSALFTL
ncbi:MAG: MBL fold metallo-hydrolase [Bacteroidales bacterium]|nr:MBL fold metallo-hydrolase [Bacteroidales bacterium]